MAQSTPHVHNGTLTAANLTVQLGTMDWLRWLNGESTTTFRFTHREGSFTARRERKAGGWYWYAYRRQQGKLHKAYLGKAEELTLHRLQQTAVRLARPVDWQEPLMPSSSCDIASFQAVQPLPREKRKKQPIPRLKTDVLPDLSSEIYASSEAAFDLLSTRLYIPFPQTKLVTRQRLLERLATALHQKLTLVIAPAGSGKTTLLSQWLTGQKQAFPVGWLSLDTGDNDPMRFWTYFMAALEGAQPGVGQHGIALLRSLQSPSMETILTTLMNSLLTIRQDMVLVLDDYHVISAPQIQHVLAFLIEHLPPRLHLVIASRCELSLPLARLRTQGQLTELHATDLRFTDQETSAFLTVTMGLTLVPEDIATLEERTEGWITGLQLAALSLQEHGNRTEFIRTFHGNHRYVVDFLVEEVLRHQPEHIQRFLLFTSVLERFCAALCNEVTLLTNSQSVLAQLEQANLFLVPLDDERHWYRYHHLFADALRERLQQLYPDVLPRLHQRAAQWYRRNHLMPEALHHASALSDSELVAQLLEECGEDMVRVGQIITVKYWLDLLPEDVLHIHPRLSVLRSAVLVSIGQLEMAVLAAQAAEEGLKELSAQNELCSTPEGRAYIALTQGQLCVIRATIAAFAGDISRAVELSQEALHLLSEDELFMRSVVSASLGTAYTLCGKFEEANQALIAARAISQPEYNTHIFLATVAGQAYLLMDRGLLHQAAEVYRQALQLGTLPDGQRFPATSIACVGLGEIYYQWNELLTAEKYLEEGIRLGALWGYITLHARGYAILARVKAALGKTGEAFDVTREAEQQGLQYCVSLAVLWAQATRARINLNLHNVDSAVTWVQGTSLNVDDAVNYLTEYQYITLARVLLVRHRPNEAIIILNKLLYVAEAEGRMRSCVEILLLLALAYEQAGDRATALPLLARSLTLAEPEKYVRIFLEEGTPLVNLLMPLIEARRMGVLSSTSSHSLEYVGTLLEALGICVVLPQELLSTPSQPLIEPLSQRELTVLHLIASGKSNQQIADELIVALSTVKWHIKHLYAKLNVHSRTQLLARARKLHLLV